MPIPSYDEGWLDQYLQYDSTRRRGLIAPRVLKDGTVKEWRDSLGESGFRLLNHVIEVFNEYQQYWPLSIRQVYYRCVGRWPDQYRKDAWVEWDGDGYVWRHGDLADKVERIIGDARRAGVVPWDIVRDDGAVFESHLGYDGPKGFWVNVYAQAQEYERDRLAGQDVFPEIWCEAAGMVPQLTNVTFDFGVPVLSSGGTTSLTVRREAAQRFAERKMPTYVLHIGDHDPSGVMIYNSLREDVSALGADLPGPTPYFRRLAITDEQIATYLGPGQTQPAKGGDAKRGKWGTKPCAQAEALPPDVMADIVRAALEECLDIDRLNVLKDKEEQEREYIKDEVVTAYQVAVHMEESQGEA